MKKIKNESGITLVALIITIIVLLILAIVSIRAIQQGGIIGKAQNAVDSYEDKRKEEENRLSEYETFFPDDKEEKGKMFLGEVLGYEARSIFFRR